MTQSNVNFPTVSIATHCRLCFVLSFRWRLVWENWLGGCWPAGWRRKNENQISFHLLIDTTQKHRCSNRCVLVKLVNDTHVPNGGGGGILHVLGILSYRVGSQQFSKAFYARLHLMHKCERVHTKFWFLGLYVCGSIRETNRNGGHPCLWLSFLRMLFIVAKRLFMRTPVNGLIWTL